MSDSQHNFPRGASSDNSQGSASRSTPEANSGVELRHMSPHNRSDSLGWTIATGVVMLGTVCLFILFRLKNSHGGKGHYLFDTDIIAALSITLLVPYWSIFMYQLRWRVSVLVGCDQAMILLGGVLASAFLGDVLFGMSGDSMLTVVPMIWLVQCLLALISLVNSEPSATESVDTPSVHK